MGTRSRQVFWGAERYIVQTVSELKKRGVKNSLLYSQVHSLDPDFVSYFDHHAGYSTFHEQIKRIQPDIIYIHQLSGSENIDAILKTDVPTVRFYHDHRLFCLRQHKITFPGRKPCTRKVGPYCYWQCMFGVRKTDSPIKIGFSRLKPLYAEQAANRKLDAFIVGSHYMAKQLQMHEFSPQKTWIMPLYAEPAPSQKEASTKDHTLLYVGTLTRGKGLDTLLYALKKVPQPWCLNVVGSGPQESQFKRLSESLNIGSSVHFAGRQSGTSLHGYYSQTQLVVLPARAPETFALIGPEAFSFGKPVVATNIGGTNEWLEPGVNGLSVPPNDPDALAGAITTLLRDHSLSETFGRNALALYEKKFAPQTHINSLLTLFDQLTRPQSKGSVVSDTNWGRFTAYGNAAVETDITRLIHDVSRELHDILKAEKVGYTALIMLGGYGRGEGGVVTSNGEQFPHNNFDFMLIVNKHDAHTQQVVDTRIRAVLAQFESRTGIGMDLSTISARRLKHASNMVIWYDMRFGHKTLLGDASFVPYLRQFKRDTIPSADIRNLLVNRGTLLVINQLILEKPSLNERDRKTIIKHAIKGIIGYGDALLYYHDQYHWSYKEKQRHMRSLEMVGAEFRQLYEDAMNFRFRPDYDAFKHTDLQQWMCSLRLALSDVHLYCERSRLGKSNMSWDAYMSAAFRKALVQNWYQPRHAFKQLKNLIKGPKLSVGLSVNALGCRLGGYREMLSIFFPVIAYDLPNSKDRKFIRDCLGAPSDDIADLRSAYLKCWGTYGDTNFQQVLDQLELSLESTHS